MHHMCVNMNYCLMLKQKKCFGPTDSPALTAGGGPPSTRPRQAAGRPGRPADENPCP